MNAEPMNSRTATPFHLGTSLRPYVGSKTYRDAMSLGGSSVCLVTALLGNKRMGRTVTSVFSLSIAPPAILVSIDIGSALAGAIAKLQSFSFAILADTQRDMANAFSGHVPPERRFENGQWHSWKSGHPRLIGAVTAMDCDVIGSLRTTTQVLFAGGVVDVETDPNQSPLIWHQREFKSLAESARSDALVATFSDSDEAGRQR